jgi:hypothetical protein
LPPQGPTTLLAAWMGPQTEKNLPKRLWYGLKEMSYDTNEYVSKAFRRFVEFLVLVQHLGVVSCNLAQNTSYQ